MAQLKASRSAVRKSKLTRSQGNPARFNYHLQIGEDAILRVLTALKTTLQITVNLFQKSKGRYIFVLVL